MNLGRKSLVGWRLGRLSWKELANDKNPWICVASATRQPIGETGQLLLLAAAGAKWPVGRSRPGGIW